LSSILGIFTSASARQYKVGDTGPGGGRIFYVAPTTFTGGPSSTQCKYLEAAPTSGDTAWTDATYVWSGNTSTLIGATAQGTAIGTGYGNTIAMVTQSSTANRAGTISRAYRGPNNLSDWYLPSKDELNQLRLQRATVGGFVDNLYFASSEVSSVFAVAQLLTNGGLYDLDKSGLAYVRPIRAF
jgi:hypothetical protein